MQILSHFLVRSPCTTTALVTKSITLTLVELLGGGFSVQEAVLAALHRILRLIKINVAELGQIAQAVAVVISRWLEVGPVNHALLSSWQAHMLACLRLLTSLSPGELLMLSTFSTLKD